MKFIPRIFKFNLCFIMNIDVKKMGLPSSNERLFANSKQYYNVVNQAVLNVYKRVPEAYRQVFIIIVKMVYNLR